MTPEDRKFLDILLALREPTSEMVYDATNAGWCTPEKAKTVWKTMIDRLMNDLCKGEAECSVPIVEVKAPKRARPRKTRD